MEREGVGGKKGDTERGRERDRARKKRSTKREREIEPERGGQGGRKG